MKPEPWSHWGQTTSDFKQKAQEGKAIFQLYRRAFLWYCNWPGQLTRYIKHLVTKSDLLCYGLHISLGVFNRLFDLLETACQELDLATKKSQHWWLIISAICWIAERVVRAEGRGKTPGWQKQITITTSFILAGNYTSTRAVANYRTAKAGDTKLHKV